MRGFQKFLLLGFLLQNVSGAPKRDIPDHFVIKHLKGDQKNIQEMTQNHNPGYTLDTPKIATNEPKLASSKSFFRNTHHGLTTDILASDSLGYQNYKNYTEFIKESNFPFIKVSKSNSRFNTERGSEKHINPIVRPSFQPEILPIDNRHRSYEKETPIINTNSKENTQCAFEMSEVPYKDKMDNNNLKERKKDSSINVITSKKPLNDAEEINKEGAEESQYSNKEQIPYFSNEFSTLSMTLSATNSDDYGNHNDSSLLAGGIQFLKKKNEESAAHDFKILDHKNHKTLTKETRLNGIDIISLSETAPHPVRSLSLPHLKAPNQGQNEIKIIDHFPNLPKDNTLVDLKKLESKEVDPSIPDHLELMLTQNKTLIKTGSYNSNSSKNANNSFRGKVTINDGTFAENKLTRKQQAFSFSKENLPLKSQTEDEQDENSKTSEQQINVAVSTSAKSSLPTMYELPDENKESDQARTSKPRKDTIIESPNLFGTPINNEREDIEITDHRSEASIPSLGLSTFYGTPIRDQQSDYSVNEPKTVNIFNPPQGLTSLYAVPSNNFDNSESSSNQVPFREIYFPDETLEPSHEVDIFAPKTRGVNSISSEDAYQNASPESGQVTQHYNQGFKIPIPSEDQLSLYELPDPDLSTGDSNKSEQKIKPPTKDEPLGESNQDNALLPFSSEDQGQRDDSNTQNMMGMPFDFGYSVEDPENGNMFSHNAASDGQVTEGEYRVLLPDGRLQIVQFRDEGMGFVAKIRYENPTFGQQKETGEI